MTTRRDFLRQSGALVVSFSLSGSAWPQAATRKKRRERRMRRQHRRPEPTTLHALELSAQAHHLVVLLLPERFVPHDRSHLHRIEQMF